MCYPDGARPPDLPEAMAGGAADGRELVLRADDGNRLRAYAALPQDREEAPTSRPGIVVIPDIRGLMPFYEELALRFAEAGVRAVAIDLYCRTAEARPRSADFDYRDHVAQTTPTGVAADVAAGIRFLRSAEMSADGALFTVGFCFGGRASLLQAAEGHGLAGVVGFYGFPTKGGPGGAPAPIDVLDRFHGAVLGLYGGADDGIPVAEVERFDDALAAAGIEHESVTYPGAPHGFFDRHAERFAEESADAWGRMLAFIERTPAPA
jgi:carboxymethylenebutenolidase